MEKVDILPENHAEKKALLYVDTAVQMTVAQARDWFDNSWHSIDTEPFDLALDLAQGEARSNGTPQYVVLKIVPDAG